MFVTVASESVREAKPLSPQSTQSRSNLSNVSFDDLQVRVASCARDFETVADLRARGFGRLLRNFAEAEYSWLGEADFADRSRVLIAESLADGMPLATMRIQDGRWCPVELASLVPLETLLSPADRPIAQFARLSAPKSPRSRDAMFALFKSAWLWSRRQGIESIVLATPPWARPIYELLLFRDCGPDGTFQHGYGAPAQHRTMIFNAQNAEGFWRSKDHPLVDLFFDTVHPNLELA